MKRKSHKIPDDFISLKYTSGMLRKDPGSLFGVSRFGGTSKETYSRYVMFLDDITEVLKEFGIHITNNGYSYIS